MPVLSSPCLERACLGGSHPNTVVPIPTHLLAEVTQAANAGARVLMFEVSTPLVHLRWLLQALGKSRTRAYKINGLAMMGAFALVRCTFGTRASPSASCLLAACQRFHERPLAE